jgi:hypothetical protein
VGTTERLAHLVWQEHARTPVGVWGFFFPVTVAVWRFLIETHDPRAGKVHALWHDQTVPLPNEFEIEGESYFARRGRCSFDPEKGPLFLGDGGNWLMELVEAPAVTDALEAVAYAVPDSIPMEHRSRLQIDPRHIPQPDARLVQDLATALQTAVASAPKG